MLLWCNKSCPRYQKYHVSFDKTETNLYLLLVKNCSRSTLSKNIQYYASDLFFLYYLYFIIIPINMYMHVCHVCHSLYVEVQGQLSGLSPLLYISFEHRSRFSSYSV